MHHGISIVDFTSLVEGSLRSQLVVRKFKMQRCLHLIGMKIGSLKKRTLHASSGMSFATYSKKFQDTQKRDIRRGDLSKDMLDEDKRKLDM